MAISLFSDTQDKSDQSTAAQTWWGHNVPPAENNKFYSATHGLVQTHPSLSGGISRPTGGTLRPSSPTLGTNLPPAPNVNPKSPFRHLDFTNSATAELRRNPSLSAPDECARACREGEPPRICYYHFTLEYYTVLGA